MDIFRYKAIIFDVGDTLLKRKPSNDEVLMERCKEVNLHIDLQQAYSACKKSELWIGEQILRELKGASRMPDEEFSTNVDYVAIKEICQSKTEEEITHIVRKLHEIKADKQEWIVIDGVYETLEILKEKGFILGIVSNFDKSLLDLLKKFNLIRYFDDITISSVVKVEKPDPEILLISCNNLSMKAEECLYVGDHPFDVLCAKEANMDIALICSDNNDIPSSIKYKEDYKISSVKALITE